MKTSLVLAAVVATIVMAAMPIAWAQSGYDWRTGNSYTTVPTYGGGANIYGYNTHTGSSWNTQVAPNGDMMGTDSHGNVWTYNRATGSYSNSDGHGCVGQGMARTCW